MAHIGNASNKALAITNAYVGSANGKAMPLIKGWMGNANSKAVPIWSKETGWVWQKYAVNEVTETGYREVAGDSTKKAATSTFYVGSSYTLSQTTGRFSVNHNTKIANSSAGAKAAIGKYYTDNLHTSIETSTQGEILYLITAAKHGTRGVNLTVTPYTAEAYSTTKQEKGDLLGTVTSADITAYPMNGIHTDGYWYVLQNEIAQLDISYSGTIMDEAVQMQNGAYRLLTLTGSGSLSIPQAVKADIWLCGGGLNGEKAGMGGNGACAASASEQTIQSLTASIGAAAADSTISGDVSLTATKATASSSTGSGTGGGGHGSGASTRRGTKGDGLSKLPFGDSYFTAPFCDGGGGGGFYDDVEGETVEYNGGDGGTNGGNGGASSVSNINRGGSGGGLYGGDGGKGGNNNVNAGAAATGYGSGGGGGGYFYNGASTYRGAGGSGYQGVCFIRIPLEQ